MVHKGIEYSVVLSGTPGVWNWRFQIGGQVKTGRVQTNLSLLAMRRVQLRIDRALKEIAAQTKTA
jgi:hypothetical protein